MHRRIDLRYRGTVTAVTLDVGRFWETELRGRLERPACAEVFTPSPYLLVSDPLLGGTCMDFIAVFELQFDTG